MLSFYDKLNEVSDIINSVDNNVEEEWTYDHSVWFVALLLNEFKESVISRVLSEEEKEIPKVTADEAAEKMSYFLRPPGFVVDTPFPNTWDMWWQSVADLINEGKVIGEGGKPNYEGAMRGWKNRVKEQYGFRPTRTKERTMTEHIKQMVSGASKIISSKRKGMHLPKELISKAAKILQGRGVQKKRKAEYEKLQQSLRPGHSDFSR